MRRSNLHAAQPIFVDKIYLEIASAGILQAVIMLLLRLAMPVTDVYLCILIPSTITYQQSTVIYQLLSSHHIPQKPQQRTSYNYQEKDADKTVALCNSQAGTNKTAQCIRAGHWKGNSPNDLAF